MNPRWRSALVVALVAAPLSAQEPVKRDTLTPSVGKPPLPSARTILRLPELQARIRAEKTAHIRYSVRRTDARLRGETVGEWLGGLPGIKIVGRGPGGAEHISIRGSRAQDVRVTLDGVPLADPLTGAVDLSGIPASSIESAQVTVGAGSAVGWGGMAGSLALRSRVPEPGVRIRGRAGSFGQRATDVEAGVRTRVGSAGLFAHSETAQNDYLFRNRIMPGTPLERRANADGDAWTLVGRAALSAAPIWLVARADGVERGAPGRMGNHVWDDARWKERRTSVAASWAPSPGRSVGLSWARRSNRFRDGRVDREEALSAEQLVLTGFSPLFGGFDLAWEGSWANVSGDHVEERQRWRGGLRTSRLDEIGRGVTVRSALSLDAAEEGLALSPSVGLSWAFAPAWEVRARGSQARRLPTFGDLFLRPGTGARPNPDLKPERVSFDVDLGLAWEVETVSASTTLFRRQTLDPIIWLPSVVAVWTPRNLGQLDAFGLELSGRWRPGAWRIDGAATWQRSHVTFENGARNALPYEPALSGSLSLGHESETRGAVAQLEFVGRRATSILGPHDLDPYALLNIRARQTFPLVGFSAEVQIGVLNALGARYERVELFPEPGRRFELGMSLSVGARKRLPGPGGDRSFPDATTDDDRSAGVAGCGEHARVKSGPSQQEKMR